MSAPAHPVVSRPAVDAVPLDGNGTLACGRLHVLVPYDDGPAARAAVRRVAPMLQGHRVTIVTTWRSIAPAAGAARAALPAAMIAVSVRNWDEGERASALRRARHGAAIACEHGLDARAEAVLVEGGWVASIASIARERGAAAVVLDRPRPALARLLARRCRSQPGSAPLLIAVPG